MSDLDWAVGFLYQEKVREREAELACAAWEACGGNGRMGSERLMFGGADPTVLLAPDPPRFPKLETRPLRVPGRDILRRAGAARLRAERRGWRP